MRGDHPSNTRRRSDSKRAARQATRVALAQQFNADHLKATGKPFPLATSRPKFIGAYPGRLVPCGPRGKFLTGGGWVPAFRRPISYGSSIRKAYV